MKSPRFVGLRRIKRRLRRQNWNYLSLLSLGILSLGSFVAFSQFDRLSDRLPGQLLLSESLEATTRRTDLSGTVLPANPAKIFASAESPTVSEVFQDAKEIAAQALAQTEVLRSQEWDASVSEQEWRQIESFWQAAENKLAAAVSYESASFNSTEANRAEALALDELKTHYHDYSNRQDLTLAIEAYQQSVFIAAQLDPSEATLCDTETQLSDSPEKWEMVVSLRQQSVDHLKAVARNVSFYDEQVVPLIAQYQQALITATRMHQRSPWYYAIQKAVCATQWGEQAKVSGERTDWVQAAAFWKEGIALLENAPERIPSEIPNRYRESYQAAQGNLELWQENLKDAETRAVGAGL